LKIGDDRMDIYFRHNQKCFNFRVAAIIRSDDKILLSKFNDVFTLPGGRVKFGETTEKAIQRKIFEELNLKVKISRLSSINENFFEYGPDEYHEVLFIYLCDIDEIDDDKVVKSSEEYHFVPFTELVHLNLKPGFLLEELKKLPLKISHNVNK